MPVKNSLNVVKSMLGSAISILAFIGSDSAQAVTFAFNNHQYVLTDNFGSWTKAQSQSEEFGGHLVTITSEGEQNFLIEAFGGTELLWIGLTDKLVEGEFQWIDGESVTFSNWAAGEPNNELIFGGEDYAVTNWLQPGLWNDLPDDIRKRQLRGIIEIPFAQVPEPATILGTLSLGLLGINYWRKRQNRN